ncbi:ERCC4 domain-containing protein [Shouchella lonarensis]|uniref:ERCC4 domain-containing protein n=1 Tax=Shouchella lonarensis TaxID=1464122 RepID=A0A1G6ILT8_9BACI|nr:ERCC4 domain-containing protein [Shouchella lonarensis]
MLTYRYSKSEIERIIETIVITVDTREKKNEHIREYFALKGIPFVNRTMRTGDYGCYIPANEDMGIMRDLHVSGCVERKATVDELVGNFSSKNRTRFENELIRASRAPFTLLIEDIEGYRKILEGNYRSQYTPQALLGSLKSFEARYGFTTFYIEPALTGNYIYHHFKYLVKELLKS